MTKTLTLTYTIDVEEMTEEQINERVYQCLDVGVGLAYLDLLEIHGDEDE